MHSSVRMSIVLSDAAIRKVAQLLESESDRSDDAESERLALRVAVRPGGCSGFSYEMYFDAERHDGDRCDWHTVEHYRVAVVVDAASAPLLMGATLDYQDSLQKTGFAISNPNATRTCGCGSSFS